MTSGVDRRPTFWPCHSLTVLIAVTNQRGNLEPTVTRVIQALSVSVEDFEIIVVDDGSTDGTADVAAELAARYPSVRVFGNVEPRGVGYCYVQGIEQAAKSYFVYVPGDNTWPERSFLELFGQLGKADVVTSYSTNVADFPLLRRVLAKIYTGALNLLFGLRMRYYNGLTVYPLAFLTSVRVTAHGFGFQAEILLRAIRAGLSYVEVAIPVDASALAKTHVITPRNINSVLQTIWHVYWDFRRPDAGQRPRTPTSDVPPRPLTIILTGASSGIGAALARALAADGHTLFVCARRKELLDAVTVNDTIARGRACDVADENQVREFMDWVKGFTPSVDAVINCAGQFGAIGAVNETGSIEWFDVIRVNVFGTYLVSKYAIPLLAGSSRPRIINFAGGGAFTAFRNYSAYAASKAAIVRLTECMAAEFSDEGVAVNALSPGFVATEFHEKTLQAGPERAGNLHYHRTRAILGGRGVPMSVPVDCTRFLLSDEAIGLTGKTISANFDPWRTAAFRERLEDITRSDLYTMRRVNIVNLPPGSLRTTLGEASACQDPDR